MANILVTVTSTMGLGSAVTDPTRVNPIRVTVSSMAGFGTGVSARINPIRVNVSAGFKLGTSLSVLQNKIHIVSVGALAGFGSSISVVRNRVILVNVTASFGAGSGVAGNNDAVRSVSVTAGAGFGSAASSSITRSPSISVTSRAGFGSSVSVVHNRVILVNVTSSLGMSATTGLDSRSVVTVTSGFKLGATVAVVVDRVVSVTSAFGLGSSVSAGRAIAVNVTAGLALGASVALRNRIISVNVTSSFGIGSAVAGLVGTIDVSSGFAMGCSVRSEVRLSGASGVNIPVLRGLSRGFPLCFVETSSGLILGANGINPMIAFDPISGTGDTAGLIPPGASPLAAGDGTGRLTGRRYAYARFLDASGNASNLSPVGDAFDLGHDGLIEGIEFGVSGPFVIIDSPGHGLQDGDEIIIGNVPSAPIEGTHTIAVVNSDRFMLETVSASSGVYNGGGWWVRGSEKVVYSGVPVPVQSKVIRRQILRTLEGTMDAIYVDVDTTDLTSTTFESSRDDDHLATGQCVVLDDRDVLRYGVPPSNRPCLVSYKGRVFAAGDQVYNNGCVLASAGSTQVRGIGTSWTSSLIGREIAIPGCPSRVAIRAVDVANQMLTLDRPYPGSSVSYTTYWIRSSPSSRKTIQWCEPGLPEAWPPWNAVSITEDGDEIVGLVVRGDYLYLVERNHIYRCQYSDDPSTASFFLMVERGAISHRLIVKTDEAVYLMDGIGFYSFDGGQTIDPISDPIQLAFQDTGTTQSWEIDWSSPTTLWHASHEAIRGIIRWFVAVKGKTPLTTAFCYDYRQKRWWLEEYPVPVTSSVDSALESPGSQAQAGHYLGVRRAVAGLPAKSVGAIGEGLSDLVPLDQGVRGSVSGSGSHSLEDTTASFQSSLAGACVSIVSGTGSGQTRLIASATGTELVLVDDWQVLPDQTSVYQIGGIPYEWRSGWLDVSNIEDQTAMDMIVSYQPTVNKAELEFQYFHDHKTTPDPWRLNTKMDGVRTAAGSSAIIFDMSAIKVTPGFRRFRASSHQDDYGYSDRFVQVRVQGTSNAEQVRIYQLTMRGTEQEGE